LRFVRRVLPTSWRPAIALGKEVLPGRGAL